MTGWRRTVLLLVASLPVSVACGPDMPAYADVFAALGLPGVRMAMRRDELEVLRAGAEPEGYGDYRDSVPLGEVQMQFEPNFSSHEGQPAPPWSKLTHVWLLANDTTRASWEALRDRVGAVLGPPVCLTRSTPRKGLYARWPGDVVVYAEAVRRRSPDGRPRDDVRVAVRLTESTTTGVRVDCRAAAEAFPWESEEA